MVFFSPGLAQAWALEPNGPLATGPAELVLGTAAHEEQLASAERPWGTQCGGDMLVAVRWVSEMEPHRRQLLPY